jgi:CO/xanthine dehydrogenase FAD-binding subunit
MEVIGMNDFEFTQPESCSDLAVLLQDGNSTILAGGSDLIPRMRRSQFSPDRLVDISHLSDLRSISRTESQIKIGSLSTHADLIHSDLLQQSAPLLAQAAKTIGCQQTRQRGTLGGNLANASPAADTAPALLALDAEVNIAGLHSDRTVPLTQFFITPGKTCLQPGEYITGVQFGIPTGCWGTSYIKLGKRNGMAIAIASVAVYLEVDPAGFIRQVRVAFGSVAPTPLRCSTVENLLSGKKASPDLFEQVSREIQRDISPIDDIRATETYRRHAVEIILNRALSTAWQQTQERTA